MPQGMGANMMPTMRIAVKPTSNHEFGFPAGGAGDGPSDRSADGASSGAIDRASSDALTCARTQVAPIDATQSRPPKFEVYKYGNVRVN